MSNDPLFLKGTTTEGGGKKKKKDKKKAPERGIETWYRVTSKNLYTRRQIVDTKSNILVSVNSIIISVALGGLYPRLQEDPHLVYALTPLVLTNLLSIAFAIFATRPRLLASGRFSEKDVQDKQASLVTFDDFYKMPYPDYQQAVNTLMQDGPFLYGTITRDIYRLGVDLSRRYKYIRISYNVFLMGIVISVFFFGLCHALF